MSRPAVPATAAPAVCDAVKGGESGGDAVALPVVELDGEKTAVVGSMALASELCRAKVDITLATRFGIGTELCVEISEAYATVTSSDERAVVELLQCGAGEVIEASDSVLSRLGMSLLDKAVPFESAVGLVVLSVDVVFQARYPGSPSEYDRFGIEEVAFIDGMIVVVMGKVARLTHCDFAPIDDSTTADASALRTADIESTGVLSDIFEIGPEGGWEALGNVVVVCEGLDWLLLGDNPEEKVAWLGTVRVPVFDIVVNEAPYDVELDRVQIRDFDVVRASCAERANDEGYGAKEAMNDTVLATTRGGTWEEVLLVKYEVWYQLSLKP
jgi:hypothetical protein